MCISPARLMRNPIEGLGTCESTEACIEARRLRLSATSAIVLCKCRGYPIWFARVHAARPVQTPGLQPVNLCAAY